MSIYPFRHLVLTMALLPLLGVGGCASNTPSSSFFILNSLYSEAGNEAFAPNPNGVSVGFGPLLMPDYLDRPQIVTRSSLNELQIDEFHRWGGDLSSDVKRVMAQNLSLLLNSDRVQIYPWVAGEQVEYQVRFALIRLDGEVGKQAWVRARWEILQGEDGKELGSRLTNQVVAVEGPGFGGLVAAQSKALAAIAREISDALQAQRASP
jgi:hypothetical protein